MGIEAIVPEASGMIHISLSNKTSSHWNIEGGIIGKTKLGKCLACRSCSKIPVILSTTITTLQTKKKKVEISRIKIYYFDNTNLIVL